VVRAVRIVTRDAGVRDRGVLPQEWTALLGVAARAALIHRGPDLEQLLVRRPVRVVARGTLNLALADWHVIEAVQPVDHGLVAGAAQLRLSGRLDLLLAFRRMYAVAGEAPDVALIVLTSGPKGMRRPVVTGRAALTCLLRRQRPRV